ncbi:MAG: Selenocysteine-specific translation elongation factor, partial [Pelotomaculum thermopropionicum]
ASKPLKNRTRIRFYLGTAETLGRVVLLDREELKPGAVAYAQLELEHQAVAAKGDRFVIRSYSPMLTIGGGTVIDPLPKRKHKRFRQDVLVALATREKGTPEELLEQYLAGNRQLPEASDAAAGTGLTQTEVKEAAGNLSGNGKLKQIKNNGKVYLALKHTYLSWADEIVKLLHYYHQKYPLREGYPKEELRSRKFKQLNNKIFQLLLLEMEQDGLLRVTSRAVLLQSFEPGPGPEQQKIITKIKKILKDAAFLPPSWKELCRRVGFDETAGSELLQYLLRTGEMVKVTDDLYFSGEIMVTARERLSAYLREQGEITVGGLRDLLQTSRKYALPLLEYFDREKITRRVGDKRLPGRAME